MADQPSLQFSFSPPSGAAPKTPDDPLRILVIGNFSGSVHSPERKPLQDRKPAHLDIDTFDSVMARLSPSVQGLVAGDSDASARIVFEELDDFHPDALFDRVATFATLRTLRKRLLDPATFEDALRELTADQPDTIETSEHSATTAPASDDGNVFERLLGSAPADPTSTAARVAPHNVESLVRNLVAPFIEPGADPRQDQYAQIIDDAIAGHMRSLLHQPDFQRLEASWRAVHELITGVETGDTLEIFLFDASREELLADLCTPNVKPDGTVLHRQLVEKGRNTSGGQPWSLIVADYEFGADGGDVGLLAALGALGSLAGGPVLAGAQPTLFGCDDLTDHPDPTDWQLQDDEFNALWTAFRASPMATWIGLATPRMLARVPYGPRRDEIERFEFDEIGNDSRPGQFLWNNPAYAAATLIARSFTENGWQAAPGDLLELGDLPACSVSVDGEARLIPCAQVLLSERAAATIAAQGIMPVLSHAGANRVRFAGIHSIAEPQQPLSGPWDSD